MAKKVSKKNLPQLHHLPQPQFPNTPLQKFLAFFEHLTNKVIPYLVILLAVVLILENPFWALVHFDNYHPFMPVFDIIIVFFFVVDLTFKWFHVQKLKSFVKLYWLDMVAVFPFYLIFRAFGEAAAFFRIGEEVTEASQKATHELLLVREAELLKETKIAEEVKLETKLLREEKLLARSLRMIQRFLRVLKGRFYITHHALMAKSKEKQ